jgi:YfiH family protein
LILTIPALERPGFVHGFSTRSLGQMRYTEGPLLTAARRRFAEAMGLDGERLSFAGAVHAAEVARIDRPATVAQGCDALITAEPGLPLFATFADCYPILLFDPVRPAAALVHAGWRGTAAGVVTNTVRELERQFGSRAADMLAGFGPGICGSCYEVGTDVAARFPAGVVQPNANGRFLLDLAEANHRALVQAGIDPTNVFQHGACTLEDERLSSHRRDGDGGRFACIVALSTA